MWVSGGAPTTRLRFWQSHLRSLPSSWHSIMWTMSDMLPQSVRQAWCRFLDVGGWQFYVTATFRTATWSPEHVRRCFRAWLEHWQVCTALSEGLAHREVPAAPGQPVRLRGPWANAYRKQRACALARYFAAVEEHESGALHLHALIRGSDLLPRLDCELGKALWPHGNIRMGPPESDWAVRGYTSKSIIWTGDFDVSGNLRQSGLQGDNPPEKVAIVPR